MDNGTRVVIRVPFGPNAGIECGRGIVTGRKCGGIDGDVLYVKVDGETVSTEYAVSWVKRS